MIRKRLKRGDLRHEGNDALHLAHQRLPGLGLLGVRLQHGVVAADDLHQRRDDDRRRDEVRGQRGLVAHLN